MRIKNKVLLILLGFPLSIFSQMEFSGNLNLRAYYSGNKDLPFWFYSNQRGRISENTNFSSWVSGAGTYEINKNSFLEIGGGLLYENGSSDRISIDELYADYRNSWFRIILGAKQKEELYNGLSGSNENILWSLNSRPLPGLQIRTNRPVFIGENKRWGIEATWEEYLLGKKRYVKNARLHHKSFHILYRSFSGWQIRVGIQHFAQWAGTSPDFGEQPHSPSDYLKIITGRGGGEGAIQGDVENALGNHLGSYELSVKKKFAFSEVGFIYNSIFEDGSGSRFANFPDGRYGLFWKRQDNSFINYLIYEFYYTRDQSHDVNRWGADNYFEHTILYFSGWTYQDRIMGTPFFESDPENYRMKNNRFTTHHLGVSGNYHIFKNNYPYKLMLTYLFNEGTYVNPYPSGQHKFYTFLSSRILSNPFELHIELGSEYDSLDSPTYGIGLHLKRTF